MGDVIPLGPRIPPAPARVYAREVRDHPVAAVLPDSPWMELDPDERADGWADACMDRWRKTHTLGARDQEVALLRIAHERVATFLATAAQIAESAGIDYAPYHEMFMQLIAFKMELHRQEFRLEEWHSP